MWSAFGNFSSRLLSIPNTLRKSRKCQRIVAAAVVTSVASYEYIKRNKVYLATHVIDDTKFMAEPITDKKILLQDREMKTRMEIMILNVQSEFCKALEKFEDTQKFKIDRWKRPEGGGGITCVMEDGDVFEKAGVNISVVHGILPPAAAQQMRARGKRFSNIDKLPFFAAGISCVIHPRNPNVPTIHFNYRYFEVDNGDGTKTWWFGGGTDMTPYILDVDDARHFHATLKECCDRHGNSYYSQFKKWCDEYFYVKHRAIYPCLKIQNILSDGTPYKCIIYFIKILIFKLFSITFRSPKKNKEKGYSYEDRQWQLLRRGRYVEFNLIYDRGTKFGLMTPGARYESILMSLPPFALISVKIRKSFCACKRFNSKYLVFETRVMEQLYLKLK
ncbi:UNVERIFIED_CONTAM: Coprox [Trichonephila clavipes]